MVARWEYFEKIKSKAFIISLILTPALMLGFAIVPSLLALKDDTESRSIGIIDQNGSVMEVLKPRIEEKYKLKDGKPNYIIVPLEYAGDLQASKHNADALVLDEKLEGYLVIGQEVLKDTVFEYRSLNVGNIKVSERITRVLRDIIIEKKLTAEGLDLSLVQKLKSPIELKGIKLSKEGKEEVSGFEKVFFTSYGFVMMMFILVLTSGQMLVRSMLEEKSNRVVEVLLSSCSSMELMSGKIIGLCGLGLTQMALWGVIGIALSMKFGALPVTPDHLLLIFIYFILGYLFYAALFVAMVELVSTEKVAQLSTNYVTMLSVMPIMFAFAVLQNPNSTFATIMSFIPLTTPTMMALRIPIQMPATWEIVGTIISLTLSSVLMMWVAGKIFRTTILLTGKRPSLGEIITIVRTK